ncbi:hypothetical protein ACFLZC_03055, partial [Patescibacteria group bacterium]
MNENSEKNKAGNELEEMKRRLYKKDEIFSKRPKREDLGQVKSSRAKVFWRDKFKNQNEKTIKERIESSRKNRKKLSIFWVFLVLFVLLIAIVASFVLYFLGFGGKNIISSKNIEMSIEGPSLVESGENNRWYIFITNKNETGLELADLIIEYPKGALSLNSDTLTNERRALGEIMSGEMVTAEIDAFLLGEENEEKEIKITLEYRLVDSNAIFAKSKKHILKLSRSPIGISLELPKEVESGQEIAVSVEYVSNSEALLKDIYLELEYPPGFQFLGSSPQAIKGNNLWKIGDL